MREGRDDTVYVAMESAQLRRDGRTWSEHLAEQPFKPVRTSFAVLFLLLLQVRACAPLPPLGSPAPLTCIVGRRCLWR